MSESMSAKATRQRADGFTLLELLLATAVGAVVLLAILNLFRRGRVR